MAIERLDPLNDFLMLKMLGEAGDEEQLLEFLKATLRRTGHTNITSVDIIGNTKLTAEIIGDKSSVLDILAVLNDGTHVNTEIQIRRVVGLERRFLKYWAEEYSRSLSAGQTYDMLPNVITIIITEFDLINLPDFHFSFHLREDQHPEYILTDAMEFHIISMPRFRRWKEIDLAGNPLHRWLTFFDKKTPQETLEEVIRMDHAIQRANERIAFVSQDKESLRLYRMREMAMSDWSSGVKLARSEGRAEGRAEGRVEGRAEGRTEEKIETAKSALRKGMDIALISELTGLDEIAIEKLRTELNN
jgi:predicted transposase/invertase (TIGR01784 family)